MSESLIQAYTPLFFWTGIGFLLVKFLPEGFPKLLGRGLYWVGVPCEIFALARQTGDLSTTKIAPLITVAAILLGLTLGAVSLYLCRRWLDIPRLENPSLQGSWLLCSMLGNTGFIGLSVVPFLVDQESLSWAVFYSVTQNVMGTYGFGVLVASYYGRQLGTSRPWWELVKDVVTVPSLWGFLLGFSSRNTIFPEAIETVLHGSVMVVIAGAFILMGIRLSQIKGWQSLKLAAIPAILKTVVMPGALGLGTLFIEMPSQGRLALVIMAGVPSAFAGLILSEEYNLDRDLAASSIINSTAIFLVMIPVWVYFFA
jgi:malate permease and related proteins